MVKVLDKSIPREILRSDIYIIEKLCDNMYFDLRGNNADTLRDLVPVVYLRMLADASQEFKYCIININTDKAMLYNVSLPWEVV